MAEAGDVSRAALATNLAAKIYGLQILKKNVADAKHNTTRFVVLAKKPKWPSRAHKRVVTTFVFQVRNIPAALYKALGGFATNGVNMTKLESYMVGGSFSATQFYADVQGHPKDRAVELALEELEFVSQPKTLRILGVYPAHRFRETSNRNFGDEQRRSEGPAHALQMRFTLPSGDPAQLIAMIKAAAPFYQMFGNAQVRLLQNVDDPAKLIQEIEYEAHEDWELNRQRIAGDVRMQTFLQTWGVMFPGALGDRRFSGSVIYPAHARNLSAAVFTFWDSSRSRSRLATWTSGRWIEGAD